MGIYLWEKNCVLGGKRQHHIFLMQILLHQITCPGPYGSLFTLVMGIKLNFKTFLDNWESISRNQPLSDRWIIKSDSTGQRSKQNKYLHQFVENLDQNKLQNESTNQLLSEMVWRPAGRYLILYTVNPEFNSWYAGMRGHPLYSKPGVQLLICWDEGTAFIQ